MIGGISEIDFLRLKVEKLENKLKCPACNSHYKEVILPCNHMFCEDCIMKNIKARQRQCPLDRLKISENEIRKIKWGEAEKGRAPLIL